VLRDGRAVAGVHVVDHESGEQLDVRARSVISATGVWSDRLQELAGRVEVTVRPAKGVHIVVPHDRIESRTGLLTRTPDSVLAIRPWAERYWIIGTTDTPWEHDRDDPTATAADIDYLLEQANQWLRDPLTRDDIVGVYSGVRPLVSGRRVANVADDAAATPAPQHAPPREDDATAALSRDHAVLEGPDRMFTVVGGKYTTYRVMAKDAVDAVVASLPVDAGPCVTRTTPIVGASGVEAISNRTHPLARAAGVAEEQMAHLIGRYGSLVDELSELLRERPELAAPIDGAEDYLQVEAVYAASHEGALHLDDVLARRLHVSVESADRGLAAAPHVAQLVGEVLGWDGDRRGEEIRRYERRVEADRCAEREPTDAAATAVRRSILAGAPSATSA